MPAPRSLPPRGRAGSDRSGDGIFLSKEQSAAANEAFGWRCRVTYVVYTVRLTSASRADLVGFWRWVKARDAWFYKELPMVKSVRRYVTAVGGISTGGIWAGVEGPRAGAAHTGK